MMFEEIKRYDPYTDKFIKNITADRIEVGTDGSLYNLSVSNSFGLYAKNQEELDKCDHIDKSTKLYTKDEVIATLTELKKEIDAMSESVVKDGDVTIEIISFGGGVMQKKISKLIQSKIDKLKENKE